MKISKESKYDLFKRYMPIIFICKRLGYIYPDILEAFKIDINMATLYKYIYDHTNDVAPILSEYEEITLKLVHVSLDDVVVFLNAKFIDV